LPTSKINYEYFSSSENRVENTGWKDFWVENDNDCEIKSCTVTLWDGTCSSTALPTNTIYIRDLEDPWKVYAYRNTPGGWGPYLVCYKCLYGGKEAGDI